MRDRQAPRSPLAEREAYWREKHLRELTAYLNGPASRGDLQGAFEALKKSLMDTRFDIELLGRYLVAKGVGSLEEFRAFAHAETQKLMAEVAALQAAQAGVEELAAADKSGSDLPPGQESGIILTDREGVADASISTPGRGPATTTGEESQPASDVQASAASEAPSSC